MGLAGPRTRWVLKSTPTLRQAAVLEIAGALAAAPKVPLLDEPAVGMNTEEIFSWKSWSEPPGARA